MELLSFSRPTPPTERHRDSQIHHNSLLFTTTTMPSTRSSTRLTTPPPSNSSTQTSSSSKTQLTPGQLQRIVCTLTLTTRAPQLTFTSRKLTGSKLKPSVKPSLVVNQLLPPQSSPMLPLLPPPPLPPPPNPLPSPARSVPPLPPTLSRRIPELEAPVPHPVLPQNSLSTSTTTSPP